MNVVIQKDIPAFHYPFRARILAILFVQSTEISDIMKKADSTSIAPCSPILSAINPVRAVKTTPPIPVAVVIIAVAVAFLFPENDIRVESTLGYIDEESITSEIANLPKKWQEYMGVQLKFAKQTAHEEKEIGELLFSNSHLN